MWKEVVNVIGWTEEGKVTSVRQEAFHSTLSVESRVVGKVKER